MMDQHALSFQPLNKLVSLINTSGLQAGIVRVIMIDLTPHTVNCRYIATVRDLSELYYCNNQQRLICVIDLDENTRLFRPSGA